MQTDSKELFSKTPVVKLFFIAAIPGMISMLTACIYSIVEGAFIGQFIGGPSFAAQNLAMPFVMIVFAMADLVGVGSSVQISIALGKKDEARANGLFSMSVLLIFVMATLMGLAMFFAAPPLLRVLGAEGETHRLAVSYLRVYALGAPICCFTFAMDNYLRISGFIRGSMCLNIFMSGLNIGLLTLLIPILDMDITGAALASAASFATCATIAFIPFLRKKAVLRLTKPLFDLSAIRSIVVCGMPVFLSNIAGRLAAIIMNVALLQMGGDLAVSAYGVLMYSGDFARLLLYGMNDSLQPAIGYNWGAGDTKRVKAIAKCVFTASGITSVVIASAMYFLSRPVVSIFVAAEETALLALSERALRFYTLSILVNWFGFGTQCFHSAIEKPFEASLLSVSAALVFPLLTLALLWPMGLDGLWLNNTGTYLMMGILAFFLLRRTLRAIRRIEQEKSV